ncbi:hypothetical protein EWM62_07790 [Mucilaginibacter terrigena]|uniref:Uncharacterized protein n=1 Tax=Mucilaginibacter terrigena TaxID=2492395 RepID=A0A4Q5LLM0_9SPHI|nr:hypothetical protein [Mucilaginibacter terrigena]RYU90548.1 hypothetical protein EWM62_07790 [Mucilaginibacter terrigena]
MDFKKYISKKEIAIIVILILLFILLKERKQVKKDALSLSIHGIVDKVKYGQKNIATVTVHKISFSTYSLIYNKRIHISVGDTVIKDRGSLYLKILKKK